jgi:hypothetical protein
MRWIVAAILLFSAPALFAGEGRVIKVLTLFLDSNGRDSTFPSLFERDAYQVRLRTHPAQCKALRFAVQWKARKVDWTKTRIVVEARTAKGNALALHKAELPLHKGGFFSKWNNVDFEGTEFKTMGQMVAWRVTLWEGNQKLGEQKSFLW